MKTPLALLCLFLLYSAQLVAQSPEELIDKFFTEYQAQGSTVALDNLYGTNTWISKNSDAITTLKNRLAGVNEELVGKYHGKELIIKRSVGESLVLYSYMVKFDRQPVRFTFEFYKPNDEWIVFGFLFDDNLDDELEESAKIQMIRSTYDN